jgi:hypothetical protein
MQKFHAWRNDDGSVFVSRETLAPETLAFSKQDVEMLFEIHAATAEEAAAICNLRLGFGPYEPIGDPERCPRCDSWYYPQGSAECWRCGKVS